MTLSLAELDRWDPAAVRAVFAAAIDRAAGTRSGATAIGDVVATVPGAGEAHDAARRAAGRITRDLLAHAAETDAVARAASTAAEEIEAVKARWRDVQRMADRWGFTIDLATNEISYVEPAEPRLAAEKARRFEILHQEIVEVLERAGTADADLAAAIRGAAGLESAQDVNRQLDTHTGDAAPGQPPRDPDRRENAARAFHDVFGRDPLSAADWDTATALDPHTYAAKNGGVPSNVVVGRIRPVPGQGVVRTNMFIPSKDVWDPAIGIPPYDDNLGDDRGFSPTAGPEDSRVSVLVDYENGLIVARQNPSVNADTGEIRVGTPDVSALQRSDGSVLLKYNAADPFSPGGEDIAKGIPMSVNGTLAISPEPTGPRIGGEVTSFPALEVYHDVAGGTTPLLQSWPSLTDDASGPLVGLGIHKTVGDYSAVSGFNDVTPALPAPAMPRAPDFSPPVLQPMPPMTVLPPANLTPLGPVVAPPEVIVRNPVQIYPTFPVPR